MGAKVQGRMEKTVPGSKGEKGAKEIARETGD